MGPFGEQSFEDRHVLLWTLRRSRSPFGRFQWRPESFILAVLGAALVFGSWVFAQELPTSLLPTHGTFKSIRASEGNPKIEFSADAFPDKKFALKIAIEMHAEATAYALVRELGGSPPPRSYVRDFKLYLGATQIEDFKSVWIANIPQVALRPDHFIKGTGTDEKGEYVTFIEGLLEESPKDAQESLNVQGPGSSSQGSPENILNARAWMFMFHLWVGNVDWYESNDPKIYRIGRAESGFKNPFGMLETARSFGFDSGVRPKPFTWNVVLHSEKESLELLGRGKLQTLSLADARKGARLLAKLSREQIRAAVDVGGWPKSFDQLLLEKLIHRRNDLLRTLKLLAGDQADGPKVSEIPVDRKLSTPDKIIVDGELKQTHFDGYTFDFGPAVTDYVGALFELLRDELAALTKGLLGSFHRVSVDPIRIGLDDGIISEIILGATRDVQKNPAPQSSDDSYLVQDVVKIGFRLGGGLVVTGDLSYVKTYTIVYPVSDRKQAAYSNGFVLNPLLPFDVLVGKLPKSFVLMLEDSIEGRGRLKIGGPFEGSVIDLEGYLSEVLLRRSVIDYRNEKDLIAYEDLSIYTELGARISLDLGLVHLPLARTATREGALNGTAYLVSLRGPVTTQEIFDEVDKVFKEGDFSGLASISRTRTLDSSYSEKDFAWSFLGIFGGSKRSRYDEIKAWDKKNAQEVCSGDFKFLVQYRAENETFWDFIANGEDHRVRVSLVAMADEKQKTLLNPSVHLQYTVKDERTLGEEINKQYLAFLDKVAGEKSFIPFVPSIDTLNDRWGEFEVVTNIYFYQESLEKLLSLGDSKNVKARQDFLAILAKSAGLSSAMGIKYFKFFKMYGDRARVYMPEQHEGFVSVLKGLVWMFSRFEAAYGADDLEDKVMELAHAIGDIAARNKDFYDPTLLSAAIQFVGFDAVYLNAFIGAPPDRDNELVDHEMLFGEKGVWRGLENQSIAFTTWEPYDLYSMFDSLLR